MSPLFQAIEARSVDQEKASHVNSLTLCFRDSDKERQYQEDPDIGKRDSFPSFLLFSTHKIYPLLNNINNVNGTNYFFSKVFFPGFPASLACSLILTLLLGGLQVCHLFLIFFYQKPLIVNFRLLFYHAQRYFFFCSSQHLYGLLLF